MKEEKNKTLTTYCFTVDISVMRYRHTGTIEKEGYVVKDRGSSRDIYCEDMKEVGDEINKILDEVEKNNNKRKIKEKNSEKLCNFK